MCHKNYHGKGTELPDGTVGEASDHTQDRVISTTFQSIRCPSLTEAVRDTILNGKGDRSRIYGVNLRVLSVLQVEQVRGTNQSKHVLYPDEGD